MWSEGNVATKNPVVITQKEVGVISPEQFRGYPKAFALKKKDGRERLQPIPPKIMIKEKEKTF